MNKPSNRLQQQYLALFFASIIFVIMLFTMSFIFLIFIFLSSRGWFDVIVPLSPLMPVFIFGLISIFTGTLIAGFFSRIPLAPIREIISAVDHLADGDFNTRLNLKGPGELQNLNQSFNHMAQELGSIEVLRTDFTNNFSHEFKTPIVSIRGFAKLLKNGDLTQEETAEYLDIIISESERLAELSTQILSLSSYETVEIVGQKTHYRLDEQIRKALLLLEAKWSEKSLELSLDLEEIQYYGNEDLALQVWLNLIDNAIKFSPKAGRLDIQLTQKDENIRFSVQDQGCGMTTQEISHIFEKFYRADQSHHLPGNGIGLAIVDKLVKLMEGQIDVKSEPLKGSLFIVHIKSLKNYLR